MGDRSWPRAVLALATLAIVFTGTILGAAMFGSPLTTVDHCPDSEFACGATTLNADANFAGWAGAFIGMLASSYVVTDLFNRLFRETFADEVDGGG